MLSSNAVAESRKQAAVPGRNRHSYAAHIMALPIGGVPPAGGTDDMRHHGIGWRAIRGVPIRGRE
jgi:hypothetical protein